MKRHGEKRKHSEMAHARPGTPAMGQVWEACPRADWMLWILERTKPMPDRMTRLFACWCDAAGAAARAAQARQIRRLMPSLDKWIGDGSTRPPFGPGEITWPVSTSPLHGRRFPITLKEDES
jgi:hypothetical protein